MLYVGKRTFRPKWVTVNERDLGWREVSMLALIALIAFILSPFISHLGPWPMVTVGFCFIAAHLIWSIGLPWPRRAP